MKTAFCYLRQSVGQSDPDDSLSIEVQELECLKFAASKGYNIAQIFREANTSGRLYPTGFEQLAAIDTAYCRWCEDTRKTGQFRTQLGLLLQRLDEVDAIICYDLTRLHRSLRGSFLETLIMQKLSASGKKVLTIKEGEIDFSRFQDSLISMLTSQVNSEQLAIQKEKSKAALKRLKDSGEWNSGYFSSFGYKSSGRKREVEIDKFESEIVKDIFRMTLEGKSFYGICRELNPTYLKTTGKLLKKTQIKRILSNPIYCGYNRDSSGGLIKARPLEGKELVSFNDWNTVQKYLEENRVFPRRAKKNWLPLSGRIFCGHCGEHIQAHPLGYKIEMRCNSQKVNGMFKETTCRNGIGWDGNPLKNAQGVYLKYFLYSFLPLYFMKMLRARQNGSDKELEQIEIELRNIETKSSGLTSAFLDGLLPEIQYKANLKTLNQRKKELELKMSSLRSLDSDEKYSKFNIMSDIIWMETDSPEELTEAVRWAVEKVTIYRDKVDVQTPFGNLEMEMRKNGNSKELPRHEIIPGDECPKVLYYFGKYNSDSSKWKFIKRLELVDYYMQE